jgi:hypothetical protein
VQPIDVDSWNDSRNTATLKPHTDLSTSQPPAHSRERSLNKPILACLVANVPSFDIRQNGSLSPRFASGRATAGSSGGDNIADLKPMPYGHHRQTSIVHGIPHSRSGSAASSTSSPLSPQMIAAAGGTTPDISSMGRVEIDAGSPLSNMSGNSFSTATTLVSTAATENSAGSITQKRVERMHSGRTRREHGHHHSHSRHHHKEDTKTVGEYALHVLFTSVSRLPVLSVLLSHTFSLLPRRRRRLTNALLPPSIQSLR